MTEIEIRGKLSKADFDCLTELLKSSAQLTDHYHRLSVDLSPGFDPVTKSWKNLSGTDIRLKKSDDKEKISIKTGNFHDLERKEIEVKLQTGQFLSSLDLLEALGFDSGMIYYWESWEYCYQGVEIKLSMYTNDYFTFEIEGKDNLDVDSIARQLRLVSYSPSAYRQAIDWENQNIHCLYSRQKVEDMIKSIF